MRWPTGPGTRATQGGGEAGGEAGPEVAGRAAAEVAGRAGAEVAGRAGAEVAGRAGGEVGAERGAMTVAMLAVTLVMALALCLALVLAAVIVAEHRATSAADLGSLAAASALEGGQPPAIACARAAALVRRNRATMLSCTPDVDGSVQLWVACRWSGGLAGLGPQTAQARSRAGPG